MSPGVHRATLADTLCPPAAQRKQAKRACICYIASRAANERTDHGTINNQKKKN